MMVLWEIISQSNIYLNEINNIIFNSNVSLENNGGFASIRRV